MRDHALRVLFVMEQHLGHRTYRDNLRTCIAAEDSIQATWVPVEYAPMTGVVERLPLPRSIRGRLRGRAEVRRALTNHDHDVVFFNTHVPALLGGALTSRTPYVIGTDITPCQYQAMGVQYGRGSNTGGFMSRMKDRQHGSALRGAATIVPWSTWVADSLVADYRVPRERVDVVPPGVDLTLWRPGVPEEDRRHRPVRILFVGGDFGRKGGALLLKAFAALPDGSAELHIVTRSPVTEAAGIVVHRDLSPNQPELIALFQSCDVFVLPTIAEAFGIVAVEASAVGLPVVGTAVGGLTDVIADGMTGYLMPPGDVAVLTTRLHQLVSDATLRHRMGRAARERAESHFDARTTARRIASHLFAAVERSRA